MRILIAPNAFKESLTALEVCNLLAEGIHSSAPSCDIEKIPLADGGDGTLEVLVENWGGRIEWRTVHDPLGRPVKAPIGFDGEGRRAIVEMARASGLALLSENERNPMRTQTLGTGELILGAIQSGARELFVGIGGSATNDGGAGMASALGFAHLDASGELVDPRGENLLGIARICSPETHPLPESLKVTVLCDVDNPLCGERGASRVYGPQKGATPDQVEQLDRGLAHLADLWKRDLGKSVAAMPGAGAAGGMGGGAVAYLNARLVSGTKVVFDLTDLESRIKAADVVITGEGAFDATTLSGKIPGRVAELAKRHSKPCIGVCGVLRCMEADPFKAAGFTEIHEIAPTNIPTGNRIGQAKRWVFETGRRLGGRLRFANDFALGSSDELRDRPSD